MGDGHGGWAMRFDAGGEEQWQGAHTKVSVGGQEHLRATCDGGGGCPMRFDVDGDK